jgi:hypothetical protein
MLRCVMMMMMMMMMEVLSTSETTVNFYQTTRHKTQKTVTFLLAAVRIRILT